MRTTYSALAIIVLFTAAALGQTQADQKVEKVFQFAHTASPQGIQELTNVIRGISEAPQVSVSAEGKSLAVRGTGGQVLMAEWLFRGLDQPSGTASNPPKLEYTVPGAGNDLVRVLHVRNAVNPMGLQEISNALRTITNIQRALVCNGPRALVVRGTTAQIALADWVVQAIDRPAGAGPSAPQGQTLSTPEYLHRDGTVSVARIFYPSYFGSSQQVQEAVNMIRSIAEIQRVVAVNAAGAIVTRGSAEEVALAEWLLNALATPPVTEAPVVPMPPRFGPYVTRMFYVKNISSPQGLQEVVNTVRSKTGVMRLTAYNAARAIALRGTPDQATQAERLIREADQPKAQ